MKIIILGSTSFIAHYLKNLLHNNHHEVLLAGRKQADIYIDISTDEILSKVPMADALIHCASSFGSNNFLDSKANYMTNVVGMFTVVKLAMKANCRQIINLSSVSAEHQTINELNSYGLTKLHGEMLLSWLAEQNSLQVTTLRCSQIYDYAGLAKKHQPFLYFIINEIINYRKITLYGKEDPMRNYLHVNDLCKIILGCLEKNIIGNYGCIHPDSYKITELLAIVYNALQIEPDFEFDCSRPDLPNFKLPSYHNSILELCNYQDPITLAAAIPQIALNQKLTIVK
jgi:nucleoside-diphosphate-sugar epimerase